MPDLHWALRSAYSDARRTIGQSVLKAEYCDCGTREACSCYRYCCDAPTPTITSWTSSALSIANRLKCAFLIHADQEVVRRWSQLAAMPERSSMHARARSIAVASTISARSSRKQSVSTISGESRLYLSRRIAFRKSSNARMGEVDIGEL